MSLSLYPTPSSSKTVNGLPFSLAQSFRDRNINLPNFTQLKTKELRSGHRQSVRGLGWSIDGRKLATCGADRTIRIWVPERSIDHRASTELRGHADSVDQLVWHPLQPDILATASADKTVKIWDTRIKSDSSGAVTTISTPGSNINITYHPTGHYLAVGDKTDTVSIIDTRLAKITHTVCTRRPTPPDDSTSTSTTLLNSHDEINELSFSSDGSLLLLSSGSGSIHIHHTDRYDRIHSHPAHTANVFCLQPDPLSRFIATASSDSMISLWHATEYFSVKMITSLAFPARAIGFSFDGELLASGGEDPFISIDATCPSVMGEDQVAKIALGGGTGVGAGNTMINCLAWHPSKYVLAYAGDEANPKDIGTVRVFNL
ncbi:hypothetical protein PHSY_000973 [Pseudozyma hubeiensis SY62]|uniref:Uncharacterized protein n=1 Tax=Pseudozyma hubeiensis (strain SY62) TaxID=1305764 RepID=R9NXI7_PSEHS|nr:hypothetical protein PHSY_000973 [Pseudozyma hubeiensis SY62]GAC93408.1 hypothetical protein PHSY_000973 [Pseudozyma hubeiensis SY62]